MLDSFNYLAGLEPRFRMILERYGLPNIPYRPPGFETLCKIILEQQVSLDSAKATFDRLAILSGKISPEVILSLSEADLRSAGLSRQKASYLQHLADGVQQGSLDLESLQNASEERVRKELTAIKGIGNWTADVYLMFSLGAADVIPLTDIGIAVTIKELWEVATDEDLLSLSNHWKPHRTAAAFFLWHYYLKKRGRVIHL
jgi:DNA-3-methyladenine glycosylase II